MTHETTFTTRLDAEAVLDEIAAGLAPPTRRVPLDAVADPASAETLLQLVAQRDDAEQLRAALVLVGARAFVHPLGGILRA